ncbi:DUF5710 domain-containing protein [Lactococcus nasutitermitis]|uniref:DUF5710 domain-containing protein n=1 Tax=Lactococcus nasutitermitis TaxID=1652957 RepID=A0ABV9JF52_9LACT|nr:DUF5710 domain-containing protein [Lactococcus nasutitermitis]
MKRLARFCSFIKFDKTNIKLERLFRKTEEILDKMKKEFWKNTTENDFLGVYLEVPYSEKDEAKRLGAWWDKEKRKWQIDENANPSNFEKWLTGTDDAVFIYDYAFILEGKRECWKCHRQVPIYAYAIDNFIPDNFEYYINHDDMIVIPISGNLPQEAIRILSDKFNCQYRYSKTANKKYFANICDNCNALLGDFDTYDELEGPFSYYYNEKLQAYIIRFYHDDRELSMSSDSIFYPNSPINYHERISRIIDLETNKVYGNDMFG